MKNTPVLRIFILLMTAGLSWSVFIPPDHIYVGIFRNLDVHQMNVQIYTGSYRILADGRVLVSEDRKNSYQLEKRAGKIHLSVQGEWLGDFTTLHFISEATSELKISIQNSPKKNRIYHHNFLISSGSETGGMMIINEVDLDRYIAGVTEAEAGRRSHIEFYKAQSILARTFALSQINKHIQEGFHVCDQEHCQAYFGKPRDFSIFTAVQQTRNLVVVDDELKPIIATFHSNSGGQTANSEDVWGKPIPYLRSRIDSFSVHMPNYQWKRFIHRNDWVDYLRLKFGISFSDSATYYKATHFRQDSRVCCMELEGKKVLLKAVREDFRLKSAFFSIQPLNRDTLLFIGRGFGHGVGFCQEGAMKMAKSGYTYEEILNYYYTGIRIIPLSSLAFFKDE